MTKFTKRQYLSAVAANEAAIEAIKAELASYADRADAGENVNDMSEAWNAAHDSQYDLEQERQSIERRWSTRNWTWQDHSFGELVSANID